MPVMAQRLGFQGVIVRRKRRREAVMVEAGLCQPMTIGREGTGDDIMMDGETAISLSLRPAGHSSIPNVPERPSSSPP